MLTTSIVRLGRAHAHAVAAVLTVSAVCSPVRPRQTAKSLQTAVAHARVHAPHGVQEDVLCLHESLSHRDMTLRLEQQSLLGAPRVSLRSTCGARTCPVLQALPSSAGQNEHTGSLPYWST